MQRCLAFACANQRNNKGTAALACCLCRSPKCPRMIACRAFAALRRFIFRKSRPAERHSRVTTTPASSIRRLARKRRKRHSNRQYTFSQQHRFISTRKGAQYRTSHNQVKQRRSTLIVPRIRIIRFRIKNCRIFAIVSFGISIPGRGAQADKTAAKRKCVCGC